MTVINFENPKDLDTHIHRVGRTGRAGNKDGKAITLLLEESEEKMAVILIKNFELSGQVVTPELETLAMRDEKFKLKRMS
jgi:ATP-dependent RNA helicase DDX42